MILLAAEALAIAVLCQDGGSTEPPVQRNPDVGESRHDTSPPLTQIPLPPRPPGPPRVHPVLPVPRHHPPPDAGKSDQESK